MSRGRRVAGNNQKRANCVFCNNPGVTKQHMWPDWLKKIIPREGNKHSQNTILTKLISHKTVFVQPDIKFKRGPIGARKIRNVCGKCNSGWMSRLEESARLALTSIVLCEEKILTEKELLSIASWSAMTSIVAEYTDPKTQSIPEEDRRTIMNHGIPPSNWHIWLGNYNGEKWKQRYRHLGMACAIKAPIIPSNISCNTQSSTFVVGSLFLYTFCSKIPSIVPAFSADIEEKLLKIWPTVPSESGWPLGKDISDNDAMSISDLIFKQIPYA